MNRIAFSISAIFLIIFGSSDCFAQNDKELRIDPSMMIALKECRHITNSLGDELFPGWDFKKTPVLFYRPNVQELLIGFPYMPKGFSVYKGFNPLGDDKIYVRNDTTTIAYDDQNTSINIDSTRVLVVADPYSTMRNQLTDLLGRTKELANKWLANWNFIPDPYYKLQIILHEAFHVYQDKAAPDKYADESVVAQYPILNPENNALYVLEGNILRDAVLARDSKSKLELIKKFVAVRSFRQSLLDSAFVEYENLNEYVEGLAKYVEYKFLLKAEDIEPIKEMYYVAGFNGYRGVLPKKFRDAVDNMVNVVSVNDDRFGNKFGTGPLRFKLYDLGAFQALLLDDVMPGWKEKIFLPNVYLTNLLKQAVNLTPEESKAYLEKAKLEYKYDEAYRDKVEFEKEGNKKIEEKVSSIMSGGKTLVKIYFGDVAPQARVGRFTPFGVTRVNKNSLIYEMVPILVFFKKDRILDFKQAVPIIIDQEKQQVIFSVGSPAAKIKSGADNKILTDEFSLSSPADIKYNGNSIDIRLK
jgi:hypothetical protein